MTLQTSITLQEIHNLLTSQGFTLVTTLVNIKEAVYTKPIDEDVYIRVYTGIVGNHSRQTGDNAIRVCLMRKEYGKFYPITSHISRIYPRQGWQANLRQSINSTTSLYFGMAYLQTEQAPV